MDKYKLDLRFVLAAVSPHDKPGRRRWFSAQAPPPPLSTIDRVRNQSNNNNNKAARPEHACRPPVVVVGVARAQLARQPLAARLYWRKKSPIWTKRRPSGRGLGHPN